ncbi:O-succinylbenzoic acid--CoA ligase [Dietzia kunjamensis subsp. schimae]|uniref:O-succinylbenzoic acid--CoA ligase n=1 Tax=Dietzia kunjamensis subsp. schimae TaxID=498198 RepID=A0ABY1N349_9ACTN|nr:o-succinylbenzoate--CoA ligase [Dietzia kunjamensis]SMO82115.1 O-succinylbenzoic acid--CoA ligase [Dietzia kunjamensis subsp. schimae]
MAVTRELRTLPVPGGPAVAEVFPALARMLADRGPALLPVPADDPVRSRILVDSQRPGDPIDDRTALVVSTSGSTGTPKGAMLSAAALAASAESTDTVLGGPGRWLLALPAHHIAGLQVILRSLRAGHEPVVMDVTRGFDPASLPDAVAACRAGAGTGTGTGGPATGGGSPRAYTSLVPGQLAKVLDDGPPDAVAALAELDAVLLGGAAAAPELLARAADAGIRVVRTYGMSETAGGCVYDGAPLPGVTVEVDDDEGRVWLAGPQLASGYRNAPDHPAFARAGWFRTDDAGTLDPGGGLRILGRVDEALSVGGLTLLPQTVEDALRTHPAVVDVVVVGIPDERLGTRPVAAVTLRSSASPDDLRAHVAASLGAHSAPAIVSVLDALPMLPGGKVDRRGVAAGFLDGTIGA